MKRNLIRPPDLVMGVRKGNIAGKHNKIVDDINQNTFKVVKKIPNKKVRFTSDEVGIIEFDENNHQRRGFRNKLVFRGNTPLYWTPDEFKKDMAGGNAPTSGATRGGNFSLEPQSKYKPSFANLKTINPHPIILNNIQQKITKS